MILLAEHDETTSLAAKKKRQPGASSGATSTPKNRVWGFENTPSGRPVVEPQLTQETATGSVQYTYQIASGRAEWLSRDPIAEQGGLNLYGYVRDDPTNAWDLTGLCSCCVAEAQAVLNAANVLYSAVQDNGVENVFVGNPANDFTPEGVIKDKVEDKVIEKTAGEEASFANSLLSTIASGFAGLTHLQILHYAQNLLDAIQKYHYCRQAYARYPGLCDPTDANNLIEKAQKKVEDAKDLYNKQTE